MLPITFVKRDNKEKSIFKHSIAEHRKKLSTIKPLITSSDEFYHRHLQFALPNGVNASIDIYRSVNIKAPYPTIFYLPGTAFIAKEILFTELICQHIAEQSRCQIIVIHHRLSPEYQFPSGLEDILQTLQFIVYRAEQFKINQHKMTLIGYSSGGNFAATAAIYTKLNNIPLQRHILISPILDLSRSLKEFKLNFENKDSVISDAFVSWFLSLYVPQDIALKTPTLSPFWHQPEHLKDLPPTDIIVGEYDRFRSDSEAYYNKLLKHRANAYKVIIKNEDHSFIWYKVYVAEAIGVRVKMALGLQPIPRPLLFFKPTDIKTKNNKKLNITI